MEDKQLQKQIKVNIKGDHKPTYANAVQTTVTNEEVVMQFLFVRPNTDQGNLVSEIVLTPQHAMRLQKALDETIKKHFTKEIK